jgi:2-hydroxychromene-2-carboxylate isomerase
MRAIFSFDTNSPYAYLAAVRIDSVLGPDVSWCPIAFAFLLRAQNRTPWSMVPSTHNFHSDVSGILRSCQ